MINKFRVWDKVSEEYITPSFCLSINLEGELVVPLAYRDSLVIEAWTGLLDKNEKEIYTGDRVIYMGIVCDIIFCDWFKRFSALELGLRGGLEARQQRTLCECHQIEVIGTIHDKAVKDETL